MIENQTILVTGGAGFIGSHLVEALVSPGNNRVISLDNYSTGSIENHRPGAEYIEGHTRDIAKLSPIVPDVLFHLGEYSRVERSFEDTELVWDLNKTGTFGVVEYCRHNDVKMVYAGSSTKFADGGLGPRSEPLCVDEGHQYGTGDETTAAGSACVTRLRISTTCTARAKLRMEPTRRSWVFFDANTHQARHSL